MSTTFGNLKTRVATVLQDPNARTFTNGLVEELILSGLTEVGRIAPEEFVEDLTPVANQLVYVPRLADFGAAVPEIEVTRVEVWDGSQSPEAFVAEVVSGALQPNTGSDSGWRMWAGSLYVPTRTARGLVGLEGDYVIRVWGYSPYVQPDSDDDVISISKDVEQALVWFIRLEALDLLLANRNLFTQWQTRSGNTDMSPAALMNERSIAEQAWSRRSRSIARLRER